MLQDRRHHLLLMEEISNRAKGWEDERVHGHDAGIALHSSHLFGHATTTLPHPCTLFCSSFLSSALVRFPLALLGRDKGDEADWKARRTANKLPRPRFMHWMQSSFLPDQSFERRSQN